MKYICTVSEDALEEIFTFPITVNHDVMAEALERMKNHTSGNWKRVWRRPVSAGFVNGNSMCYGRSETLDLDSREIDTQLLRSQP